MLTLTRQVPPITMPYDRQSIMTGHENTPSLMLWGGLLIRSGGAFSNPRPNAGGELVNCDARHQSLQRWRNTVGAHHVDPKNTNGAEGEDAAILNILEAKTNNQEKHFSDICCQQVKNEALDIGEEATALTDCHTNGVEVATIIISMKAL